MSPCMFASTCACTRIRASDCVFMRADGGQTMMDNEMGEYVRARHVDKVNDFTTKISMRCIGKTR